MYVHIVHNVDLSRELKCTSLDSDVRAYENKVKKLAYITFVKCLK